MLEAFVRVFVFIFCLGISSDFSFLFSFPLFPLSPPFLSLFNTSSIVISFSLSPLSSLSSCLFFVSISFYLSFLFLVILYLFSSPFSLLLFSHSFKTSTVISFSLPCLLFLCLCVYYCLEIFLDFNFFPLKLLSLFLPLSIPCLSFLFPSYSALRLSWYLCLPCLLFLFVSIFLSISFDFSFLFLNLYLFSSLFFFISFLTPFCATLRPPWFLSHSLYLFLVSFFSCRFTPVKKKKKKRKTKIWRRKRKQRQCV